MLKLAILASGSGSNAQAMLDAVACGRLDAEISVVLTNCPGAGVMKRAAEAGVPAACVDHRQFTSRESFDAALIDTFRAHGADTLALAGFMRMVTPTLLDAFPGRVLNIHPALLPSFPGIHGAADAHAYGVKVAGCTVHFVDAIMDNGPVIIQAVVPALDTDTPADLQQRILSFEHRIYPQALQWLSEGRLHLEGRRVCLKPATKPRSAIENGFVWPALEDF